MTTQNQPAQPLGFGSSDQLGGSVNEGTDTTGPRGTYGCACVSRDARTCLIVRYGYRENMTRLDERCECLCHQWSDDE